ncbi:MAG TPA: hypothetical protein VHE30_14865 [Polyangiaceae bacterium]|nr:hypothetical protein [Polyangiaceae bacterium]
MNRRRHTTEPRREAKLTRRLFVSAAVVGLLQALLPGTGRAFGASPPGKLVIVVNRDNPLSAIGRRELSDVFLKKASRLPDGEIARPVDLRADSPLRREFSEQVLGRPVSAVRSYWQQRIFSGRDVPPPELASERDVVAYVARNRGAVGYVSANADLGTVKVIAVY